jgi:ABC-type Na+ efflux pump permease subunit
MRVVGAGRALAEARLVAAAGHALLVLAKALLSVGLLDRLLAALLAVILLAAGLLLAALAAMFALILVEDRARAGRAAAAAAAAAAIAGLRFAIRRGDRVAPWVPVLPTSCRSKRGPPLNSGA